MKEKISNERGQIAVEYILLLVTGVTIWLLLVSSLVSRSSSEPGIVIKKWSEIIQLIGSDL